MHIFFCWPDNSAASKVLMCSLTDAVVSHMLIVKCDKRQEEKI